MQMFCIGMNIMLSSLTFTVLYLILQSINNVEIYSDDALKALTPKSH